MRLRLQEPSFDLDVVFGGVGFGAELAYDLPVDFDFAIEDELLRSATGGDAV
jgi:hypothetical protein